MANETKQRYYPVHPISKPVDPALLNLHQRQAFDGIYDLQYSVSQMTGGATGLAGIGGGAVTSVTVMYPGFGYAAPPTVTVSGGGGAGAVVVATISKGRVSGFKVTSGGSGYTSLPTVTITP